jgi:hypothetical protein
VQVKRCGRKIAAFFSTQSVSPGFIWSWAIRAMCFAEVSEITRVALD